jgi:hypothetical protein
VRCAPAWIIPPSPLAWRDITATRMPQPSSGARHDPADAGRTRGQPVSSRGSSTRVANVNRRRRRVRQRHVHGAEQQVVRVLPQGAPGNAGSVAGWLVLRCGRVRRSVHSRPDLSGQKDPRTERRFGSGIAVHQHRDHLAVEVLAGGLALGERTHRPGLPAGEWTFVEAAAPSRAAAIGLVDGRGRCRRL